ncbi:hypothetical protein DSO57_1017826 [Entomophthora muscae]|uniref:Uncharacterized protein n=1 Tax=Entomophthora muscae TaxID=34485 RepID=A0ACC2SHV5_9FUNG|nr:hypothetical protein DSO57_1017826 [Entomophthora muscae]
MSKFKNLFCDKDDPLPPTNLEKHIIDTGTDKHIHKAPYCLAKKYENFVEQEIDHLLSKGIIKPSTSP